MIEKTSAELEKQRQDDMSTLRRKYEEARRESDRLRAALRDAKAWLEGEGLYDQADAIGLILGDVV